MSGRDRSKSKIDELRHRRHLHNYRCILDESYFVYRSSLLQPVLHWNFNLFTLERLTAGFPLLAIGKYLFEKCKFIQKFQLDYYSFIRLLRRIEDLYHENNPYHNALHAADVTQAIYCLLKKLRVDRCISSFDFMCAILASICHDIDHPGVNQAFLVKTKQVLFILYQESILENHHSNVCISVLLQSGVFSAFSDRRWDKMRQFIKRLILATDISKQQFYLTQMENLTERRYRGDYVPNHDDMVLVMEMAIKCADISNPCRHWEVCLQWATNITEEFFQQGDRESLLGLPVLSFMDRNKTTKAKVQISFIQFQVLPLFELWDTYVKSKFSRSLVAKCKKNLAVWMTRDATNRDSQRRRTLP